MSVNSKATLIILGILVGSVISASGFLAFNYLTSAHAEGLTVENFTVQNMTDIYSPIEFDLQNTGNTNIEIVSVTMNGYLNQSVQNWNRGWVGNLALKPSQSGKVYVYEFCYFYVLNASMPQISVSPSKSELANLNSWANLYTCTFSFITQTRNEYNQIVPRLASNMIQAWLGAPTKFTNTIAYDIVDCNFYGTSSSANNYVNMTIQNTGYSQFIIGTTAVVTGLDVVNTIKTLPAQVLVAAGDSVVVMIPNVGWTDGNQYSIQLLTTNGEKITYVTYAAPTDLFNVASVVFIGTSPYTSINMTLQNTGSFPWTITSPAQINSLTNVALTATGPARTLTCAAGAAINILLTPAAGYLVSGNQYSITVLLSDGNKVTYVATAP
jgi:hypothetical protein